MDFEDVDDDFLNAMVTLSDQHSNKKNGNESQALGDNCEAVANVDGPSSGHLEILKTFFGHKSFKPLQWTIIKALIEDKRDVCAVMATGYGKSLCFQYPSMFVGGITIIISPLISLMEDQLLALEMCNIPACLLGTAQKKQTKVLEEILDNKYSLIYVTPEFCTGDLGQDLLQNMANKLSITLIAVDEAHCVSTWGHDFRHQYRRLNCLRKLLPGVPMLAVTATATLKVRNDISASLQLRNPLMICSGFDRPNLYFEVHQKSQNGIYTDLRKYMVRENLEWKFAGPTIIYCISRKETEDISEILKGSGMSALPYHAGLPLSQRKDAHEQFVRDKINVIVATVAFGMGIDKPDIRNIIHWGASKSIESYYQEVGRAGRDGLPSTCVMFYTRNDFNVLRMLADNTKNSNKDIMEHVQNYVTSRGCRRAHILNYFGDKIDENPRRKCCDNCTKVLVDNRSDHDKYEGIDENGLYDFKADAHIFLSAVSAFGGKVGMGKYILFVRGSNSSRIADALRRHPSHGSGKHKKDEWWKDLGTLLIKGKYLEENFVHNGFRKFSTVGLTDKGKHFMDKMARTSGDTKLLLQPLPDMLKLLKSKIQVTSKWAGKTSNVQPSTSKAETDDPVETEKRMKLYQQLIQKRQDIASSLDCMPYMVASNTALMQMSIHRPKDTRHLRELQLDGFSEIKLAKFGDSFLKVMNSDTGFASKDEKLLIRDILIKHPLDNVKSSVKVEVSYSLFKSGLTVNELAKRRNVTEQTVIRHLNTCIQLGYPIKMSALGVTDDIRKTIMNALGPLQNWDIPLSEIKAKCPPEITYEHIHTVIAYLTVRKHLKQLGVSYEEFEDCNLNQRKDSNKLSDSNDRLSTLINICLEVQKEANESDSDATVILSGDEVSTAPPEKKVKRILDSPPRSVLPKPEVNTSNVCGEDETKPIAKNPTICNKKPSKSLPPWLCGKRKR